MNTSDSSPSGAEPVAVNELLRPSRSLIDLLAAETERAGGSGDAQRCVACHRQPTRGRSPESGPLAAANLLLEGPPGLMVLHPVHPVPAAELVDASLQVAARGHGVLICSLLQGASHLAAVWTRSRPDHHEPRNLAWAECGDKSADECRCVARNV